MYELIDSKLVAKLMNETAKECGMTRDDRCIVSQTLWWAKEIEMVAKGAIVPINDNYRYITKTYDFVADNFLELLAKRVEAEGFDLADNEPKVTTSKSMWSDWENKQYRKDTKVYTSKIRKMRELGATEGYDLIHYPDVEDYPKVKGPLHGSQYVRLIVAYKGPWSKEWREKNNEPPVDEKWCREHIESIKTLKERRKGERYVR
tara:strand:- start:28 stop:639 length:612 start_codon:yes stop_codon:yes gene_type:complete